MHACVRACSRFHEIAGDSRPPLPAVTSTKPNFGLSRRRRKVRFALTLLLFFLFLDIPKYLRHIRSPEGSTLSICGDSQLQELSLDEGGSSLPATSRDDSSELSFYRRFLEGHAELATCTALSCVVILRQEPPNNAVVSGVARTADKQSVADGKPKGPTYRPYTIEEYRSLSVPRPDRSLGPDKDEVQTKVRICLRGISKNVMIMRFIIMIDDRFIEDTSVPFVANFQKFTAIVILR